MLASRLPSVHDLCKWRKAGAPQVAGRSACPELMLLFIVGHGALVEHPFEDCGSVLAGICLLAWRLEWPMRLKCMLLVVVKHDYDGCEVVPSTWPGACPLEAAALPWCTSITSLADQRGL